MVSRYRPLILSVMRRSKTSWLNASQVASRVGCRVGTASEHLRALEATGLLEARFGRSENESHNDSITEWRSR